MEDNITLLQACARLSYYLNMMTVPEYKKEWRALQQLSTEKKKKLEEYRQTRGSTWKDK